MSLLSRCIERPGSMYPINDAVIVAMGADNPHIERHYITRLRCWNMMMWRCPHMPKCMAVLVYFWLAECYEGVQQMMRETLVSDDPWRHSADLFAFTRVLLTDVMQRNITERTAPRRAASFYYLLTYATVTRPYTMMARLARISAEKVSKSAKDILIERWRAKQKRKGRQVDTGLGGGNDSDSDDDDDSNGDSDSDTDNDSDDDDDSDSDNNDS